MKNNIVAAILGLAFVPSIQATWCQYFYDSACTKSSAGGTNFDCANNNVFGNGGSYIACHTTTGNHDNVNLERCADSACNDVLNSMLVQAGGNGGYGYEGSCYPTGGAGPWYRESCA